MSCLPSPAPGTAGWRNDISDQLRFSQWKAEIEALDRVLLEFPATEQLEPTLAGHPAIRLKVGLKTNQQEIHWLRPIEVGAATHAAEGDLQVLLKKQLEAGIHKDSAGTWRAVTSDDKKWFLDPDVMRWKRE